jgi:protein kinase X
LEFASLVTSLIAFRSLQMKHVVNEVKLMSMMMSPFLVELMGHFQDENRLYLVLSYVPGGELFTLLRSESAFHQTATIFYAAELILALKYLHELKVCYRDLKPENVLLDEDGHIKICDFGLAKLIQDRTWTLCGTAEYLAPEMIENKGHGLSVDWWSLGVLVYEVRDPLEGLARLIDF